MIRPTCDQLSPIFLTFFNHLLVFVCIVLKPAVSWARTIIHQFEAVEKCSEGSLSMGSCQKYKKCLVSLLPSISYISISFNVIQSCNFTYLNGKYYAMKRVPLSQNYTQAAESISLVGTYLIIRCHIFSRWKRILRYSFVQIFCQMLSDYCVFGTLCLSLISC